LGCLYREAWQEDPPRRDPGSREVSQVWRWEIFLRHRKLLKPYINMDEAIFRTDSDVSEVTMVNTRYSNVGQKWIGVQHITEYNILKIEFDATPGYLPVGAMAGYLWLRPVLGLIRLFSTITGIDNVILCTVILLNESALCNPLQWWCISSVRKITMGDVAKQAKVSVATVSRVYTDPDKVSPAKREKVLLAIQELNYQPNVLARNLRRMQTNSILVIIPNILNTLFSSILNAIQIAALGKGYQVILGNTNRLPGLEKNYLYLLQQRMVDGVIILFPHLKPSEILKATKGHPVVIVGQDVSDTGIPCVTNDNLHSSFVATEHLIQVGHKNIGYISGPLDNPISQERLRGYRKAMEQHHLEVNEALIHEGNFFIESGYEIGMNMLASSNVPSALVTASDEMAIGALQAAKKLGLSIPEQFAIIGFDDIKMASLCEPALTTIAQPKEDFGRIATDMLFALIMDEPLENRRVLIQDSLIIRKSCGSKA
jgi:LacI family repressor for deo operon, udp, cdd, tsx, nupC, and nupG